MTQPVYPNILSKKKSRKKSRKSKKPIRIELLPGDFIGNDYLNQNDCPLARAVKRHFKNTRLSVGGLAVYSGPNISGHRLYEYDGWSMWNFTIHGRVKAAYEKDPKAEKVIYYVEITPI